MTQFCADPVQRSQTRQHLEVSQGDAHGSGQRGGQFSRTLGSLDSWLRPITHFLNGQEVGFQCSATDASTTDLRTSLIVL